MVNDSVNSNNSRLGLVLLTGGLGRRLGGPKHDRPHPAGGTWGGHLVRVFQAVCPHGPVHIVGEPLPDADGLAFWDPRQGPAVALSTWARTREQDSELHVRRWWVLPCDQVQWNPEDLAAWLEAAEAEDPNGEAWVMVQEQGRPQPLGGFIGFGIIPLLAPLEERRVRDLLCHVPCSVLTCEAYRGLDVDLPADMNAWEFKPSKVLGP